MGKYQEVRLQQYLRKHESELTSEARAREAACTSCMDRIERNEGIREINCAVVC